MRSRQAVHAHAAYAHFAPSIARLSGAVGSAAVAYSAGGPAERGDGSALRALLDGVKREEAKVHVNLDTAIQARVVFC